ncbi:helix-turn-helix domain-containing protein [Hyphomonas sp.]|uniref:AraC family transcriptional regulator n=1 Tax=Hyphomonas sp. TaxID=87 RepID=UPI0025B8A0EA|nr:helix-turn-helix domain-containing protein [Hyphomonas sp.]
MLETLFRGIAIGALLLAGIAMARGQPRSAVGLTGGLFCAATIGFILHTGTGIPQDLGVVRHLAWLLSAGGTSYFWLFGLSMFSDARLNVAHALPIVVMTAIIVAGGILPGDAAIGSAVAHNILELALVGHVMFVIWNHKDDDLADARRRIRTPMMIAVGCFCAVLSGFDIAWSLGIRDSWIKLSQAGALAVMALVGGWAFVRARGEIFLGSSAQYAGHLNRSVDTIELSPAELVIAEKLAGQGDPDPIWRRQGLTVGAAADALGLPEYRLRQLINRKLGFRNFSDFLNAQRIAAAKEELRDPKKPAVRISTIAFDLGYASLGPFNRAFKEATGMSPRAWRERERTAPADASEIAEH